MPRHPFFFFLLCWRERPRRCRQRAVVWRWRNEKAESVNRSGVILPLNALAVVKEVLRRSDPSYCHRVPTVIRWPRERFTAGLKFSASNCIDEFPRLMTEDPLRHENFTTEKLDLWTDSEAPSESMTPAEIERVVHHTL